MNIIAKNSVFNVATLYHPPGDCGYEAKDLTDYLIDSCEQILLRDPNMKIIIAGDINKLNIHELLSQQSLIQMVKTPTVRNAIIFLMSSQITSRIIGKNTRNIKLRP